MSSKPKLKAVEEAPPDDHYREALRAAIEQRNAVNRNLAATKAARESAWQEWMSLDDKLTVARKEIELAQKRDAEARVQKHLGRTPGKSMTAAAATKAAQALEAEIADNDQLREHLERMQEEISADLHVKTQQALKAREDFLKYSPEVARLLSDTKVAEMTHRRLRLVLKSLPVGVSPLWSNDASLIADSEREGLAATANQWSAAIAKLLNDASTSLPNS